MKHVTDNNVDFIKLDKNATNESAREIVNLKHVTMFFYKIYVLSDQRHWKIYAYFKSRLFFLLSICASLINWITNLNDLNFHLFPPEFSIHCASDSFDS